ncbi:hypothetical protein PV04_02328 [Phialophora macrospora]|uniref:NADP-dependent oxidoreductase domain-containing protein n=1 Tax=Phialophora macrospora TaxID=1851006 RepID=A0A0D2E6V5_9EURO|nr:hypothetical protein PV04_02328 [Phialophora macrospora]
MHHTEHFIMEGSIFSPGRRFIPASIALFEAMLLFPPEQIVGPLQNVPNSSHEPESQKTAINLLFDCTDSMAQAQHGITSSSRGYLRGLKSRGSNLVLGCTKTTRTPDIVWAISRGYDRIDASHAPFDGDEETVGNALRQSFPVEDRVKSDLAVQTRLALQVVLQFEHRNENANFEAILGSHLSRLGLQTLDCLVLNVPHATGREVETAFKILQPYIPHWISSLGLSNVSIDVLRHLEERRLSQRLILIQNRFSWWNSFDSEIRHFCIEHDLIYQAFGVLTSNRLLQQSAIVRWYAKENDISCSTALIALVSGMDSVQVLTSCGNKDHLSANLDASRGASSMPLEIKDGFLETLEEAYRHLSETHAAMVLAESAAITSTKQSPNR